MRIGVNCLPLQQHIGGLRQYFQRLFRELLATDFDNSYVFFFSERNLAELELIGDDRWKEQAVHIEYDGEILQHLEKIDLLFCPFNMLWPRPLPIPSVVLLADIQEVFYPQFFTPEILEWRRIHYAGSTRAADAVITLSEFSKQTIARHHLVALDKIFVAHLVTGGTLSQQTNSQLGTNIILPERFILYPANHWHHKNHDILLKALAFLKQEKGVVIPCVCTGFPMEDGYPLLEKIIEYGLDDQVLHVGYVSNDEMHGLYSRATLLCFPSLFEGFGMPVLEAMEAGCPVVCANGTSLPEVVGDAAVLFDPNDYRDVASTVLNAWSDENLRNELTARGKTRAKQFTSSHMTTVHLNAFEYAVKTFLPDSRDVYQHFVFNQRAKPTCLEDLDVSKRLNLMECSLSWRLTRPLRWMGDKMRAMGSGH